MTASITPIKHVITNCSRCDAWITDGQSTMTITVAKETWHGLRGEMAQADKAGLALRVFDGTVLVCPKGHLNDRRYLGEHGAMVSWMDDCENVTEGINADGGAGL